MVKAINYLGFNYARDLNTFFQSVLLSNFCSRLTLLSLLMNSHGAFELTDFTVPVYLAFNYEKFWEIFLNGNSITPSPSLLPLIRYHMPDDRTMW